ncbi:MAG TPA: ABC transporter permease subunit [Verrucomicrobiae bacterium]|jgi:ABC-type transport system involved in multi-copper enzyme maturation permease subunit
MKIIFLIATDSIRALLHQRLLLGLMVASLALTVFFSITLSNARKNISESFSDDQVITNAFTGSARTNMVEQRKFREQMDRASSTMQAGFYGITSFGGSLVALFIFSTAVASEIRKGTIRLTLSKPVSRIQFLLGKYLGGVAVMAGYALVSGLAFFIFSQTQNVELSPAIKWSPWLMFCEQLMLGSLAMLLSLFMHPLIAAVLAYFAGNGFYSLNNPLYYILPSYKDFNVFFQVLEGSFIHFKDVVFLSLYAADFVIIMLLLAWWRFRSKELT